MLKLELHAHTADDPFDAISHTAQELIDRAARLGYGALAITLHQTWLDLTPLQPEARARGVVLLSGLEAMIHGRDVLLINFGREAERVRGFEDLRRLRAAQPQGLVVAPHPFFPAPRCLRGYMHRHPELFDAVEYNAMHTRWIDFNRAAVRWAARHGKAVVGNGDVHVLAQLGTTYSLVDAEPHPDAICAAIRRGRVELCHTPLTLRGAAGIFAQVVACGVRKQLRGGRGAAAA